jgi:hypothetical protein
MKNRARTREVRVESVSRQDDHARNNGGAKGRVAIFLGIVSGITLGLLLGFLIFRHRVTDEQVLITEGATASKSGPWGKLEFVPITISAPDELLPILDLETTQTQWLFKGMTHDSLAQWLSSLNVPTGLKDQFLSPRNCQATTNGVVVRPTDEMILSLPDNARMEIYQLLCRLRENEAYCGVFKVDSLKEFFRDTGVSDSTIKLISRLGCQYNHQFIFSGWPCLLKGIPTYEEKKHLVKALTRQQTLLAKLYVGPETDINSMAIYWGKAVWNTDVRSILESLKRLPNGARIDIIELMPPLPSSLLYTFPVAQNPLNGPIVRRDCHWTSFNFFRDPPDPRYNNVNYFLDTLQADFFPVQADPRFGDVVLFIRPDDHDLVHSAIFLADNIVFTKNGDTALHPWMFSTIPDLIDQYSFLVKPGQKLDVRYYRNKYY